MSRPSLSIFPAALASYPSFLLSFYPHSYVVSCHCSYLPMEPAFLPFFEASLIYLSPLATGNEFSTPNSTTSISWLTWHNFGMSLGRKSPPLHKLRGDQIGGGINIEGVTNFEGASEL
jgi:hypothetical protein